MKVCHYNFKYISSSKIIRALTFLINMRNLNNIYNFTKIYSNSKQFNCNIENNYNYNYKNIVTFFFL